MSTNVHESENEESRELVPTEARAILLTRGDPDWDGIAGLTGAREGSPEDVKRLKPIQYRAISLLLQGHSQAYVANELGVTRRSVTRWMQVGSRFKEILMERQHILWEAEQQLCYNLQTKATRVLDELLDSPDERIRLRAASIVKKNTRNEEPFNPEEIPNSYYDYYEQRRRLGGAYYAWISRQDASKGSINRDITWESSAHLIEEEYDDIERPRNPSFVLQEEEFESFALELESRGIASIKIQDLIQPIDKRGMALAEIYTFRAEQPSIFLWDNLTWTSKKTIHRSLKLGEEKNVKCDMFARSRVIIPRNTTVEALLGVLSRIAFNPYSSSTETS